MRRPRVVVPGVVGEVVGGICLAQVGNEIVHEQVGRVTLTLTRPAVVVLAAAARVVVHPHQLLRHVVVVVPQVGYHVGRRDRRVERRHRRVDVGCRGALRFRPVQPRLLVRIHVFVEFGVEKVLAVHGRLEFLVVVAAVGALHVGAQLLGAETLVRFVFVVRKVGEFRWDFRVVHPRCVSTFHPETGSCITDIHDLGKIHYLSNCWRKTY